MKKVITTIIFETFLAFNINLSVAQDSLMNIGGRLQYDNISYFNKQDDKINGRNEGFFQITFGSGKRKSTQWKAIIELREDLSDKSRDRIWLDELWIKQSVGIADITFGKQIIAWGTADGYNPVDVVNPTDYSDLLDTEDEKIGFYGIRTQLFLNSADVDIIWVPAGSYGKLPATDSRWFPSPLMFEIPASLPISGMNISVKERTPQLSLKSGEAGIRFRKRFSGFDVAFGYYNGFDHLPEYMTDSSRLMQPVPELVFSSVFYRQQVAGIELAAALPCGVSLRGEAAYFIPEKGKPDRNQYIQAITGIDKTFFIGNSTLMTNIEYIHDFRIEGTEYALFDTRHIFTSTLLTNLQLTLYNGFTFNFVSIYNMNGNNFIIRPEMNYLTRGGIKYTLRADILEGPKDTFLGSYSYNDRIQCKIIYSF